MESKNKRQIEKDNVMNAMIGGAILMFAVIGLFSAVHVVFYHYSDQRKEKRLEALTQLCAYATTQEEKEEYMAAIKKIRKQIAGIK